MAGLLAGTVTFLFTDIEGSTRLLQSLGDARATDVFETHRSLLFADGVWLVELASLVDPLVAQAFATTLGLQAELATVRDPDRSLERPSGRAPVQMLTDYLRGRRVLLILDNCEHLIAACAELAEHLLRVCPHLRIIATSREALGVAGELAYPVPSLSLPETRERGVEHLGRSKAPTASNPTTQSSS